jgi:two-component system chemotaxis response regulator CheB
MTQAEVPRVRVLVVDDSVLVRRVVGDVVAGDPACELVGHAANGRFALGKLPSLRPDVIILDVEMPEMDGLACLAEIRKQWPKVGVIMFSTLTEAGAATTLKALELGADDFAHKPTSDNGVTGAAQQLREDLLPKIRALGRRHMPSQPGAHASGLRPAAAAPRPVPAGASPHAEAHARPPAAPVPPARPRAGIFAARIDLVAVGVSTGGPNALAEVVPRLPADLPVPVVIVQHMPAMFTRLLAERLAAKSAVPVRESEPGAVLRPGTVWIAAGGSHLTVVRRGSDLILQHNQDPPENSCRPAVDVLFRSVAGATGANTLAVVLTGMGEDGRRACQQLRQVGAPIVVQDEATSVVWGMPGSVAKAGLADKVLPIAEIAGEITARLRHGRTWAGSALAAPGKTA